METIKQNYRTIILIIAVAILCLLLFNKCNSNNGLQLANKDFKKQADSSRIASEKLILKVEKAEIDLNLLKKDLEKAHNKTDISEAKLYALQKESKKPRYIESVKDCNDTIQSIYSYSLKKDSICNVVISDKDNEISKQDTIIKIQEIQKKELILANDLTNNANQNLEKIIYNDNKQIKHERNKKNFWKTTSVGLSLVVLKVLIFN